MTQIRTKMSAREDVFDRATRCKFNFPFKNTCKSERREREGEQRGEGRGVVCILGMNGRGINTLRAVGQIDQICKRGIAPLV